MRLPGIRTPETPPSEGGASEVSTADGLRELIRVQLRSAIVASQQYLQDLEAGAVQADPRYPVQVLQAVARALAVLQPEDTGADPDAFSRDLTTEELQLLDTLRQRARRAR
jgi:hypothetical protein